jgi:hypothetical protein
VPAASRTRAATETACDWIEADEQDADASAPSGSVCDSDAENAEGRPPAVRVEVLLRAPVRVHVGMAHPPLMRVLVHVEGTRPPAHKQAHREPDDDEADERLRGSLGPGRQRMPEEDERSSERDERQAVPDSPREAEAGTGPRITPLPARDEGRDGGDVIRVGGVAKAQQDGDEEDDRQGCAVRETPEERVESAHRSGRR